MRNLTVLLFLLSLCSLHLVFSAPKSFDYKTACCRNTIKVRIPLNNIVTYWKTSNNCHVKAIVFQTLKKKTFCVDPSVNWIKKYTKAVDPNNSTSA